jgi:hypothetical protein
VAAIVTATTGDKTMNNQKIASEMMLAIAWGTDTQSSSDSWNEMHIGLSRIRRLYEKAILSEIEAAVQMNSIITAAIAKHVMAAGDAMYKERQGF